MPDDLGIWRSANLLMHHPGKNAAQVAAERADDLLTNGDLACRE